MTAELTAHQLEAAITAQAGLARRYGRYWAEYAWTHAEIDRLLTEWEAARARERKASQERWWRGVGA